MNSWELLRHLVVARRDDPLWGVLFDRCEGLIRSALRSQFGGRRPVNAGLLDDLAQDVMVRLVSDERRVLSRFTGTREQTFAVYIRRIAENILLDQFRRDASRREVEQSFPPDELWRLEAAFREGPAENAGNNPEAAVGQRETFENVERTLRQISLDDRQRALNRLLFRLYFVDGCSILQIARLRAVPLSASTVARRITLIRNALRRSLAPHGRRGTIRGDARPARKKQTRRRST